MLADVKDGIFGANGHNNNQPILLANLDLFDALRNFRGISTPFSLTFTFISIHLSFKYRAGQFISYSGSGSRLNQITVVTISRMLRCSSRSSVMGEHIATSAAVTVGCRVYQLCGVNQQRVETPSSRPWPRRLRTFLPDQHEIARGAFVNSAFMRDDLCFQLRWWIVEINSHEALPRGLFQVLRMDW